MRPSDRACLALAAGIVAYDIAAPSGETISEGFDRYLLSHRWLTEIGLALVYLHVSNRIPAKCDPIHLAFGVLKRL